MSEKKRQAGVSEAVINSVNEDLARPQEPRWDIEALSLQLPNKMPIPMDADVPAGSYLRWTKDDNVDDRLTREYPVMGGGKQRAWSVVKYRDGAEKSGSVKLNDMILMAQPQDLHDAMMDIRTKQNNAQKIIDEKNQGKPVQVGKGGPV